MTSTIENVTLNTTSLDNVTEAFTAVTPYVKVWPQWVEVTVPLLCIIIFVVTLVIIFLKPSKPGDEPFILSFFSRPKSCEPAYSSPQHQEINMTEASWRPPNYVKVDYE